MKYLNGKKMSVGDIVSWKGTPSEEGVVVCLIDEGKFLDNYDFTYLENEEGGVMILFFSMGLVQIKRDDPEQHIIFIKKLKENKAIEFIEQNLNPRQTLWHDQLSL